MQLHVFKQQLEEISELSFCSTLISSIVLGDDHWQGVTFPPFLGNG